MPTTTTRPARAIAVLDLLDDVTVTLDPSARAIGRARRLREAARQAREQAQTARVGQPTNLNCPASEIPTS